MGFASLAKSVFGRGIDNSDPHHVLKLGAFLFITIFPTLYLLSLWNVSIGQQIVDTMKTFLSVFRSKGVEVYEGDSMVKAMSGWLLIANRFQTFVAASAKVSATMAISLAIGVRVRKMTRSQQKIWEDLLFGVGIVIFAYSRALSMLN